MRYSFGEVAHTETTDFRRALFAAGIPINNNSNATSNNNNNGTNSLEAHMRLAEAEMRAVGKQRRLLERFASQSESERRAAAEERRKAAIRRREELTLQLQRFRSNRVINNSNNNENNNNNDAPPIPSEDHSRRWAAVYSTLAVIREKLSHLLACPSRSITSCLVFSNENENEEMYESWITFNSATHHAISTLENIEKCNSESKIVLPTRILYTQLEQVTKMQLQANTLLHRERHSERQRLIGTAELFKDQGKLLSWCKEQRDTLDGLKSLPDLREFCASFAANVSVMDTNFLVLLERSESLSSNRAIREALVEVNQAWMELAVAAYYKISRAIREEHAASHLEVSCKWWLETFEPRLKSILIEAHAISNNNNNNNNNNNSPMVTEPLLQAMHDKTGTLIKGLSGPKTIVHHISEFTVREDCITPHEASLREALQTRLTLLTQTFMGDAKFSQQREYMDRLREIGDWLDTHSTSETYLHLMRRVKQLRDMAEEQLRLLPEDDSTDAVIVNSLVK